MAKSKVFDIIRNVLLSLPPELHRKWLSTQDLLSILKRGGCSGVTMSLIAATIGAMSKTGLPLNNRFKVICYFCFSAAPDYTCPKEQLKCEPTLTQIQESYFLASGRVTTEDARLMDGSQSQKPMTRPDETTVVEQPKAS
jgi:hypothetical protein